MKICNDFIEDIIPETLIRKTHYRLNLMSKINWDFSFDAIYDIENEKVIYKYI